MAQKLWGEIRGGELNPFTHLHALQWDAAWSGGAPCAHPGSTAGLLYGEPHAVPNRALLIAWLRAPRALREHPAIAAPRVPTTRFFTLDAPSSPAGSLCGVMTGSVILEVPPDHDVRDSPLCPWSVAQLIPAEFPHIV